MPMTWSSVIIAGSWCVSIALSGEMSSMFHARNVRAKYDHEIHTLLSDCRHRGVVPVEWAVISTGQAENLPQRELG